MTNPNMVMKNFLRDLASGNEKRFEMNGRRLSR